MVPSDLAKRQSVRGRLIDTENQDREECQSVTKMKRKEYEIELRRLNAELVAMQEWIKTSGTKVAVVFEGRDSAG